MLIREIQLSVESAYHWRGKAQNVNAYCGVAIVDASVEGKQGYAAEKKERGILDFFVMSKSAFATKLIDYPVAFVSGGA